MPSTGGQRSARFSSWPPLGCTKYSTPPVCTVLVPALQSVLPAPVVDVDQPVVVSWQGGAGRVRAFCSAPVIVSGDSLYLVLGSTARCRAKPVQARRRRALVHVNAISRRKSSVRRSTTNGRRPHSSRPNSWTVAAPCRANESPQPNERVGLGLIAPWGVKSWGVRESQVAECSHFVPDGDDGKHRQCGTRKRVAERGLQKRFAGTNGDGTSVHESRRGACYPSPRSVLDGAACSAAEENCAREAGRGFIAAIAWFSSLCVLLVSAAAGSTAYSA